MKGRKHKIGDEVGGRTIVGYNGYNLFVKCPLCQRVSTGQYSILQKQNCFCQKKQKEHRPKGRFSGLEYENSEERLNEIMAKYKDGVSCEMVENWIMNM